MLAPQVRVDAQGQIVINEQSMLVAAGASHKDKAHTYKRVKEKAVRLNSATYSNRAAPEKWTPHDTELFYCALGQFGTDFTLMAALFPGRNRRQMKNKFRVEDSRDPKRVAASLSGEYGSEEHFELILSMLNKEKTEEEVREQIKANGSVKSTLPPTEPPKEPKPKKVKVKNAQSDVLAIVDEMERELADQAEDGAQDDDGAQGGGGAGGGKQGSSAQGGAGPMETQASPRPSRKRSRKRAAPAAAAAPDESDEQPAQKHAAAAPPDDEADEPAAPVSKRMALLKKRRARRG